MFRINEFLSVGGQPSETDLRCFQQNGYQAIVNFREEGETSDQLPPSDEGKQVHSLGMAYLHLPTTAHTVTAEVFDRFRAAFDHLPRPIYAHCTTGKRAAVIALAQVACQRHMPPEQIEAAANRYELRDRRDLIKRVLNYVSIRCSE